MTATSDLYHATRAFANSSDSGDIRPAKWNLFQDAIRFQLLRLMDYQVAVSACGESERQIYAVDDSDYECVDENGPTADRLQSNGLIK